MSEEEVQWNIRKVLHAFAGIDRICCMLLIILFISMFPVSCPVKAEWSGTVYIRADGSIDPPDAPIATYDRRTYVLTGDIRSSGYAIIVERDNIVIDGRGHTLEGAGDYAGIVLGGRGVMIKDIRIRGFYWGIYIESSDNRIEGNIIEGNTEGVWLSNSSNNAIVKNIIEGDDRCIELYYSPGNIISENMIEGCTWGIMLEHSSYNTIVGNTFIKDGLFVFSSYSNIVGNNTVNGKPLVYLEGVSDHTVIKEAGQVVLVRCDNIRVENLDLSKASVGIELWETHSSMISGNRIEDNNEGIYLWNSSKNRIFHNNFINNNKQVEILFSVNFWDDGHSGNYWSDYKGPDHNKDGIGDEPYIIDERNKDNYPLMKQYTSSLPQPSPQSIPPPSPPETPPSPSPPSPSSETPPPPPPETPSSPPPPQGTFPTLYAAILTAGFLITAVTFLALYRRRKVERGTFMREGTVIKEGGTVIREEGTKLIEVGETDVIDPNLIKEYLRRLDELYREGKISEEVYRKLKEEYEEKLRRRS